VARRGAREVTRTGDEDRERREQPERRGSGPPKRRQDAWSRDDGRKEWEDAPPKKRTARQDPATNDDGRTSATARTKRTSRTSPSSPSSPTTASSTARALAALAAADGKAALPPDVATEIRNATDIATQAHQERLVERAAAAFSGYERGRYQDALRAIKQVVDEAPGVAAVRELAGLAAYRSGRWREAARHLTAFGTLSDSATHLPELMDCQRALHKPKKVAELWTELRQSSPDPDVLAEGRIVAASSLAETGDLKGAISMLATAGASKMLRNPADRHLRQWYVLADLYERAGDIPRAREYFERVRHADPQAYDVNDRLHSLGPQRRPRQKRPPKKATR
jgi:tetratricopeptide (TPR) repeat protein